MATVPVESKALSDDQLMKRFARLAATWRGETAYVSSSTEMFAHPAYQEIIRMGPAVVPLLLADLEKEPEHWTWALHVITGANPVAAEHAGNLEKMAEAWLKWGRENGYR